jgi:uncharacterized protein
MWFPEDYVAPSSEFRRPISTYIIKVASRCNLDCDYCYVYRGPDQSWRTKPRFLELNTIERIAGRIQEHVARHSLDSVSVVFHGGEPLLAGLERLEAYVRVLSTVIRSSVNYGIQTNGVLLDAPLIDFLRSRSFRIGISLDGSREHNDRHRTDHRGRSSYDDVVKSIRLLQSRPEWNGVLGGVLVVADLRNRPADILAQLHGLGVRSANILLPDCHHDTPPPREAGDDVAYGRWLWDFFQTWYWTYPEIEVPYFEEILGLMMGGISTSEEIGAKSVDFVIVDTDGDMEAVDTLKMVGRSATYLGLNVATHSFDDVLEHPAIACRMVGYEALCKTCRECEYLDNCGGGYIPHRFSSARGFINPSVYCADLKYLFAQIRSHLSVIASQRLPDPTLPQGIRGAF